MIKVKCIVWRCIRIRVQTLRKLPLFASFRLLQTTVHGEERRFVPTPFADQYRSLYLHRCCLIAFSWNRTIVLFLLSVADHFPIINRLILLPLRGYRRSSRLAQIKYVFSNGCVEEAQSWTHHVAVALTSPAWLSRHPAAKVRSAILASSWWQARTPLFSFDSLWPFLLIFDRARLHLNPVLLPALICIVWKYIVFCLLDLSLLPAFLYSAWPQVRHLVPAQISNRITDANTGRPKMGLFRLFSPFCL